MPLLTLHPGRLHDSEAEARSGSAIARGHILQYVDTCRATCWHNLRPLHADRLKAQGLLVEKQRIDRFIHDARHLLSFPVRSLFSWNRTSDGYFPQIGYGPSLEPPLLATESQLI